MKIIFLVIALVIGSLGCTYAGESYKYKIDDSKVDALFEQSTPNILTSTSEAAVADLLQGRPMNASFTSGDDKEMIAGIVALVSIYIIPIGILIPIHRFLIGTNGKGVKVFILYFCPSVLTLGIFGWIVGTVDGVMLLVDSGSKYLNNSKWIMWL